MYSSHRVKSFFGLSTLKSPFLRNLRKDIWECSLEYAEKEITADRKQKEAFCETALCHMKSARTVKLLSSLSGILTLFLFSVQRIFGSTLRLTVKKEISSDQNWRLDFRGTAL